MEVQIDNLFSGLMTGRPGVNHPDVIKSRVSSPRADDYKIQSVVALI